MKEIKIDYEMMIENYCHIVNKDRKDQLLVMNTAQKEVYDIIAKRKAEKKRCNILILKARQLGMSTFTEALGCSMCVTKPNQSMIIMTHEEKASQNLYRMTHYYYEHYPEVFKKMASVVKDNQALMSFTNGSTIQTMVASDNSKGAGRSQTVSYAHLSEFAFWGGNAVELLAGVMSACTKDAVVIIETTANGCNSFKKLWDSAVANKLAGNDDGWIPLFFPWYGDPQYRDPYTGFTLTAEEERIKQRFNLDNEQIAWRRNKIKTDFAGSVALFQQEFPATPEEAFISSGQCIFDLNTINERKEELRGKRTPFVDKGYFLYKTDYDHYTHERKLTDIKWVSDYRNGYITLFKNSEHRHPYILSIDPAGDGSDFTAIQVLDNRTCEQVAVLHHQSMTSFEISAQAYCLGKMFNDGLIGAETNFAPEVMSNLNEFGYLNLYLNTNDKNYLENKVEKKLGFRTTTVTRPYVISMLVDYINDSSHLVNDFGTLTEAENFVRVTKVVDGRTRQKEQANDGSHDDKLMALGIALYMRDSGQQTFELLPEEDEYKKPLTEFDRIFGTEDFYKDESEGFVIYDDIF